MDNRRIAGVALITIGLLGLAAFVPLYATQLQSYGGWDPMSGMMGGMMALCHSRCFSLSILL